MPTSESVYDRIKPRADDRAERVSEMTKRLVLAIPFVAMILVTGLNFRLIGDEGFFHLRVIKAFDSAWPNLNFANYSSASTPLPYVLWTIYGQVVGFEIWKLRLLAVAVTYLTVCLFYGLCRREDLPCPVLSTLCLLFSPYIFFHSFTIYTVNFGLLFGVWALHYYLLNEPTREQLLKGSLLATLAIYCRQYYLALPTAMLVFEMLRRPCQNSVPDIRQRLPRWLILSLPVILSLPLFWSWRGLTPPQQQSLLFVRPVPQHLNFVPVFVGFYFLPMVFRPQTLEMLRAKKIALLSFAFLLPLYWFFPLIYSEDPARIAAATGIVAHGFAIFGQKLGSSLAVAGRFALWVSGLLIIIGEVVSYPWSVTKSKMMAVLAVFLVPITLTPFVSERYYILTVPYLILLLHRSFRQRRLLTCWLGLQVALSVGFSYWQIALKSFDTWYP